MGCLNSIPKAEKQLESGCGCYESGCLIVRVIEALRLGRTSVSNELHALPQGGDGGKTAVSCISLHSQIVSSHAHTSSEPLSSL